MPPNPLPVAAATTAQRPIGRFRPALRVVPGVAADDAEPELQGLESDEPEPWPEDVAQAAETADVPPDHDQPMGPRRRSAEALADDAALEDLVRRIVERDERALAALYDACVPRVAALVQRIVRRAALTEEVVEDTFWQVWRQAPRFDVARGRVLTWLLAMARSRAIDALRRDERFRHDELADDDQLGDGAAAAAGADDLLAATRSSAAVQAAVQQLDPRSRQLVALAFFRGLTHEEIAEQCRMPLGTVKSLIRRALIQLRGQLQAAGCGR